MLVRTLTGDDVAAMRAMLGMFGAAFGEQGTYTAKQPDDGYLKHLLASDTFLAEGNVRRAIDFRETDNVNEAALKDLIRAAVAANISGKKKR